MKHLILALTILLCASTAWGRMNALVVGGGFRQTESGFCAADSGLWCYDGTTDGQISWSTTPATEDCDGYDANGDWCDYDTTVPSGTGYADIHSIGGVWGSIDTYNLRDEITTATEFYVEGWFRTMDSTSVYLFQLEVGDGGGNKDLRAYLNSSSQYRVYYNNTTLNVTSTATMSVNTWYKVGIYMKQEVADGNDGIIRVWWNTDGSAFDNTNVRISSTGLDTGTFGFTRVTFPGTGTTSNYYHTLMRVKSGTPSWTY